MSVIYNFKARLILDLKNQDWENAAGETPPVSVHETALLLP